MTKKICDICKKEVSSTHCEIIKKGLMYTDNDSDYHLCFNCFDKKIKPLIKTK